MYRLEKNYCTPYTIVDQGRLGNEVGRSRYGRQAPSGLEASHPTDMQPVTRSSGPDSVIPSLEASWGLGQTREEIGFGWTVERYVANGSAIVFKSRMADTVYGADLGRAEGIEWDQSV